jgi:uncharacterized membrane protein
METPKIEWKQSLIKSLIYRGITLVLGTLTAYIITGSLEAATGTALLTEAVQAANYFIYELIWSNISRKKLKEKIIEDIRKRQIDLKIDYSSIMEIAYHMSQVDTFVPKLYLSVKKFFENLLENEQLEEIHDEIAKYKSYFETTHAKRKLVF